MKPLIALVALALVVPACGAGEESSASSPDRAPRDVRGEGGPAASPPDAGMNAPPPAWIETRRGDFWLAFATYCWNPGPRAGGCPDYAAPSCGDERRSPTIVVRRGEVVRFHLGFDPRAHILLRFFAESGKDVREIRLASERTAAWEVERGGPFWIDASEKRGSASYAGCFRLKS